MRLRYAGHGVPVNHHVQHDDNSELFPSAPLQPVEPTSNKLGLMPPRGSWEKGTTRAGPIPAREHGMGKGATVGPAFSCLQAGRDGEEAKAPRRSRSDIPRGTGSSPVYQFEIARFKSAARR